MTQRTSFAESEPTDGLRSTSLHYRIKSAESLVREADELFTQGYWSHAESRYSYAIELFPSAINYCCRAFFFLETSDNGPDRSDDALRDAKCALRREPNQGLAHFVVAKCAVRSGRLEEARLILKDLAPSLEPRSALAVRLELCGLDVLEGLIYKVNQSFLSRDWRSLYRYAKEALTSAPRLRSLIDMKATALTHLESETEFLEQQAVMKQVRRALDQLVNEGKDYKRLLCLTSGASSRASPISSSFTVVTDEDVKDGFTRAFVRLAMMDNSCDSSPDLRDVEEAYHFLLDADRRNLYFQWRDAADLFDPNDTYCFNI